MVSIYIGNHFTVSRELIRKIVEKRIQDEQIDLFMLNEPLAFIGNNDTPRIFKEITDDYKLEYKFGSSFSGQIKAIDFKMDNIVINKSLYIDLILYIQKQLSDKEILIDFKDIPIDDSETFNMISNGSSVGLAFLEIQSKDSMKNISNFQEFSIRFPNYCSKRQLHLTYWLAYLKTHYPVEFLSSLVFLSFGRYRTLLDVVQELGNLLCSSEIRKEMVEHFKNNKGFHYPGKYVVLRKKHCGGK